MDRSIVGRIELLAVVVVNQHRPGAVVFATAHPAGVVLHGDEAALIVTRMPVRVAGLSLEHADAAIILNPPERAMIRDVTPDQAAPITHPHGALTPERTVVPHAVPDALQRSVALHPGEA